MRPWPLLVLILVTIAECASAAERLNFGTAQTYFAATPDAPPLARDFLQSHPKEALRIVSFGAAVDESRQIFQSLTPIVRSQAGVCRFTATQIFPHRSLFGAIAWDSKPAKSGDIVQAPVSLVQLANPVCPGEDDNRYISVAAGISDSELLDVMAFWREVSASPEKFDAVSRLLPFILSPEQTKNFTQFRESVLQPGGAALQLKAINRRAGEGYEISLGESGDAPGNEVVGLSRSGDGFRMLEFNSYQY